LPAVPSLAALREVALSLLESVRVLLGCAAELVSFATIRTPHAAAKVAIGRACLRLLDEGDSVSWTTEPRSGRWPRRSPRTRELAPRNLVVLTNAVPVAAALADTPGIEHVLLGGQLRRASGSIVGALALNNLQRFAVGVAFISASGCDAHLAVVERDDDASGPVDDGCLDLGFGGARDADVPPPRRSGDRITRRSRRMLSES
jgi:DeoR/GlpR family transcriptional regulator of sugar metabolism